MPNIEDTTRTKLNEIYNAMGIIEKQRKTTMKLEKHTSKSFDADLKEALDLFLRMGEMVEKQVSQSVHALTEANADLALSVINKDSEVDQIEREIDERVMYLVVKRQPTANDFRAVFSISKGVVDIERIGDESKKIAMMAKELAEKGAAPLGYAEVQHMSTQVRQMLHNALESFENFDADQALEVIRSDTVINREYQSASRSLMTYIMEDSTQVSKVINIMWVLRALERIGDHAKNIAELVIYTSSGTDVKHSDYQDVEKAVQEANQKAINSQKKTEE